MHSDTAQRVLRYITDEFVETGNRTKHESYCMFPFEACSCKGRESIDLNTPLMSGGYVDSFSMVSIGVFLEKDFGLTIPDSEVIPENFNSVQKIVDLIERLQK